MTPPLRRPRVELLEDRAVPAAVGALDPSFSPDAPAGITAVVANRQFVDVAVQQDGKIVAVSDQSGDFFIARFNPDGSPDLTFSNTGTGSVTIDVAGAGQTDQAFAVEIDPQNRIVVVGSGGAAVADFALVRLAADGKSVQLNVHVHVGNAADPSVPRDVAFQSDGTIVAAGTAKVGGDTDFALVRFNGTTGAVIGAPVAQSLGTGDEVGRGVAVYPNGPNADKIVVVGETGTAGNTAIGIIQRNADGTPDLTFNPATGQKIIDPTTGNDSGRGVEITASGSILVAGHNGAADRDLVVVQLLPTGAFDGDFNLGAVHTITKTGADFAQNHPLALQPDGRIVVVGDTGGNLDAGVFRLNADGSTDTSFGTAGDGSFNVNGNDDANAVAIDNNGRILVAGDDIASAGFIARLIGTVEKGTGAAVGGPTTGTVLGFVPTAAGALPAAPTFTSTPFGALAANVRSAIGDVNGDGFDDGVLVTGPGVPIRVTVVSGVDATTVLVAPFDPFGGNFTGGGFVAVGDFDLDGRAEFVVTPDQGGGPRVSVFTRNPDGTTTVRANFLGIDDDSFRGGARAAVGDVNGDGVADLAVSAGFLGGPRTALFDGKTIVATPTRLINDFLAFPGADANTLRNGVFVAAGDVNGDGFAELIFGGGPGGAPRVFILSGALVSAGNVSGAQAAPVGNFFVANNSSDRGGVRVAAADLDGDNRADVLAGSGEGSPAKMRVYLGKNVTTSAEPGTFQDVTLFGGGALPGGVFVG